MSSRRNSLGTRSASIGRQPQPRTYANDSNIDLATKNDALPDILPDVCTTLNKNQLNLILIYFFF